MTKYKFPTGVYVFANSEEEARKEYNKLFNGFYCIEHPISEMGFVWKCKSCVKTIQTPIQNQRYCPICGARMEE